MRYRNKGSQENLLLLLSFKGNLYWFIVHFYKWRQTVEQPGGCIHRSFILYRNTPSLPFKTIECSVIEMISLSILSPVANCINPSLDWTVMIKCLFSMRQSAFVLFSTSVHRGLSYLMKSRVPSLLYVDLLG